MHLRMLIVLALCTLMNMPLSSGAWANFDFYQVKPRLVYQPDGTEMDGAFQRRQGLTQGGHDESVCRCLIGKRRCV